jgi:methyl-accepting chemotaxis protein
MENTVSSYAVETANHQIAPLQQELYGQCRNTFESFQGLGDVAEDMRILSLNAELAAGRAGTYGVSIRALTQYTRELVNRLEQINLEMQKIETFQEMMQSAKQEAPVEAAVAEQYYDENGNPVEYAVDEYAAPETVELSKIASALQKFDKSNGGVKYLNEQAKRIAEVVSQSNSIATNMAIEAATAGQYEDTFTNVANDMRGFVNTLKTMVTRAQDSIEKAFRAERSIKEIEATARQA